MLKRPYVDSTREEIERRPYEPVDNGSQYCSIVRTSLGEKTIIMAGEVDGGLFEVPLPLSGHRDIPSCKVY